MLSRALIVTLVLVACGKDIDVGGGVDASDESVEAGTGQQCEPCSTASDCLSSDACGQISGDAYCARLCPNHNECAPAETCTSIVTVSGARADACIPTSGTCAPAPPPMSDGGALTHCGVLDGPTTPSSCHSCGSFATDCQKNGCYGGWWCNAVTRYCERPPKSCP